MDEPVSALDVEIEPPIRVYLWDEGTHKGISMQTSKDSWIAMRDGLDLRKWA